MLIRREVAGDADRVAEVQRAAFGQDLEAELAIALRTGGHAIAELCLVAEVDGVVAGHVVCSRGSLDGRPSVGLGPIGVDPALQRSGLGSALMHAVLGAADALDEPLVALLGDPAYYARFGFVASVDVGVAAPDPAWGAFFQVRTLTGFGTGIGGQFHYAEPFENL